MFIRVAKASDLDKILAIYEDARSFMRSTNNPNQWRTGYPPKELICSDISEGALMVVEDGGEILAVFFSAYGKDKTYAKIYEGEWGTDEPCGIIHRVAVSASARGKGVFSFIAKSMLEKYGALRIDTHENNIPMQKALSSAGFTKRGIIYLKDIDAFGGKVQEESKRIAYDIKK